MSGYTAEEGVNYFHPVHYSKDTLRAAAAPAQLCQSKVRPCPGAGKASLMHVPFGVVQILSIHGAVSSASTAMDLQLGPAEHSSVWKEKDCRQMEPGRITEVHGQTSAQSHSSFLCFQNIKLLSPPFNSHPRLHGNKPRLGTCLKGELPIGKLNHIRKC